MGQGEAHVASYFSSGASRTSPLRASALARAIRRARAPAASTPSFERLSAAANPQQPEARTRIPIPADSEPETWPARPFLVVISRPRVSTARASAYETPRRVTQSRAARARSFILA